MKALMTRGWVSLLLICVVMFGCFGRREEKAPPIEELPRIDSKELPDSVVTSHLQEKIAPGKNLIYCSTFQLAWNELRDGIVKEDVRLSEEPPMVNELNKKLTTKADVSEDSYVAMAGFGKDNIVEKINEALASKFGAAAPTVEEELLPDHILAYAFLLKDLRFHRPFESLKEPVRFQSGSRTVAVKAFGIEEYNPGKARHAKLAKQVRILTYNGWPDGFVIGLVSTSPQDEIILAKVQPRETLLETIRAVEDQVRRGRGESLGELDTLQIPKLDFNIGHSYSELVRKYLLNEDFTDYYIARARQDIRFRLNERGAVLRSAAKIQVEAASKRLVFDRPFLLYLKQKRGKLPYFAIWVDNPEILLKQ